MTHHYYQLNVSVSSGDVKQIHSLLANHGALSISIMDAADQPIYEPPLNTTPLWQQNHIQALFSDEDRCRLMVMILKQQAPSLTPITTEVINQKDWLASYRQQCHPLRFGENLWVVPSWQPPPDPEAVNIMLDPGLAFGTGTHATTALCLRWLSQQTLQGKTFIDYGCGSGILAIAAHKLGTSHVYAIDIDPQACQATLSNAQKNHIAQSRLSVHEPENFQPDESVDVIIANILANPLIALRDTFIQYLKPQGHLILSGINTSQVDTILSHYRTHFSLTEKTQEASWQCLQLTKK